VLVGSAELVAKARRNRKVLGGALRQVGVLAAAGLYALEHNVDRLAEDHANARRLAEGLAAIDGLSVAAPETNIVWVTVRPDRAEAFARHLAENGVGITSAYAATQQRWVTHLDVGADAVDAAIAIAQQFFTQARAAE
jgi:threonine aldolase